MFGAEGWEDPHQADGAYEGGDVSKSASHGLGKRSIGDVRLEFRYAVLRSLGPSRVYD